VDQLLQAEGDMCGGTASPRTSTRRPSCTVQASTATCRLTCSKIGSSRVTIDLLSPSVPLGYEESGKHQSTDRGTHYHKVLPACMAIDIAIPTLAH
jgi:hypothetical protein